MNLVCTPPVSSVQVSPRTRPNGKAWRSAEPEARGVAERRHRDRAWTARQATRCWRSRPVRGRRTAGSGTVAHGARARHDAAQLRDVATSRAAPGRVTELDLQLGEHGP